MSDVPHLNRIERTTVILATLFMVASFLFASRRASFGVCLGAALMVANAYAIRRIGARVLRTFKKPGLAILLFNAKMLLLVAIVWALIRYLPIDPVGFIIGISVFPLAIVAAAIQHGMSSKSSSSEDQQDG